MMCMGSHGISTPDELVPASRKDSHFPRRTSNPSSLRASAKKPGKEPIARIRKEQNFFGS